MFDFDPGSVDVPVGHVIDGKLVTDPGELQVRRPSDGVVYAQLPVASAALVDEAVRSAQRAFETSAWARSAPRERAKALRRWADLIDLNRRDLGALEALGSTRPVAQASEGDVVYAADCIRFFAEYADKLGGEVAATRTDQLGLIISEPYGVVGAIAPWNFPVSMAAWKAGPALAAGNAVVLKPSELTPFSAVRLAQLAVEAGVPPGIFNVVQGTGPVTGEALCRHPAIGKISFTGSNRTGAHIMAAAAMNGTKPVTLELGGKSPQLVFADAPDLEKVARCVARGILSNAGQVCVAGSRLIVERRIAGELVARIAAIAGDIRPGPTWRSDTGFPPIISAPQAERIDRLVRASLDAGAEAVCGGRPLDAVPGGAYYTPTVLTGVTAETAAVREEVFGPVLTVQTFEDEAEGLALADHPEYGLAAAVYTADLGRAMRAVRAIKAGTVWVNRYGRTGDHVIPTGGFKGSGIGKDLGRQAVEANLRSKSALIHFNGIEG